MASEVIGAIDKICYAETGNYQRVASLVKLIEACAQVSLSKHEAASIQ
jgi:hypothetical protein